LCLSLERWLFFGHSGSPLSLVVKLNEAFVGSNAVTTRTVFAPCGDHEKNAALDWRAEVEIALLPFDGLYSKVPPDD